MFNKKNNQANQVTLIRNYSCIASEAIQKLQTNLSLSDPDHPVKVIGVTSSIQSEGKSTLTANMANIYAFRGAKTIIVSLDLRRPSIHHFYHLENKVGITEYVTGEVSLDDIIVHTEKDVDVINSGTISPFPTKILSSPKLDELFAELRKRYDYILVDSAPVLLVTDATLAARLVDGYIFVAAQHITKKKNIKASVSSLRGNGVNVIGVVVTQATDFEGSDSTTDSYRYYYKKKKQY
ncbi:MAG: CpsD/CapB family tyrosine-protein kinase [Bacilli bacterium]